jgi:hypothetical protein
MKNAEWRPPAELIAEDIGVTFSGALSANQRNPPLIGAIHRNFQRLHNASYLGK